MDEHSNKLDANRLTFLEDIHFIKEETKPIYISGIIGVLVSGLYLLITPNVYKAVVNVSMTQVVSSTNALAVNVEEPTALIARLRDSSSFDSELIDICNFQNFTDIEEELRRFTKFSISKTAPSVVEIAVMRPKQAIAKLCAESIYKFVVRSQMQMAEPIIEASRNKSSIQLAKLEKRLLEDRLLMTREQARSALTQAQISLANQIRALEDQRDLLLAQTARILGPQGSQLNPPIYVAYKPFYPKSMITLAVGLLGGILFGVCIALVSKAAKLTRLEK